jgi:hypothetical protein
MSKEGHGAGLPHPWKATPARRRDVPVEEKIYTLAGMRHCAKKLDGEAAQRWTIVVQCRRGNYGKKGKGGIPMCMVHRKTLAAGPALSVRRAGDCRRAGIAALRLFYTLFKF